MQVPFVGFQPIRTSEHMAAAGKTSSSCPNFCHQTSCSRKENWTLLRCLTSSPWNHAVCLCVGGCVSLQVSLPSCRRMPSCSISRTGWLGRSSKPFSSLACHWQPGRFSSQSSIWPTQVRLQNITWHMSSLCTPPLRLRSPQILLLTLPLNTEQFLDLSL